MAVRFNKHFVTNGETKARVFYSLDNHVSHRPVVTLYARDHSGALGRIFSAEYRNETDLQTDYFDQGHADLFEEHSLYAAARKRAEDNARARAEKAALKAMGRDCPSWHERKCRLFDEHGTALPAHECRHCPTHAEAERALAAARAVSL